MYGGPILLVVCCPLTSVSCIHAVSRFQRANLKAHADRLVLPLASYLLAGLPVWLSWMEKLETLARRHSPTSSNWRKSG